MPFVGAALPLTMDGLAAAATHLGVDPGALWSVVIVETSGCGFLPDRRPSILFERHIFSRRTRQRFDASNPEISGPAGGYGRPGAYQYERLERAIGCDRLAALESASWGLGQIMGFNATVAGFRDAEDMVAQMLGGENAQILGMARFVRAGGMHTALQRRDWSEFARRYNGSDFARNRYHEKLATAHASLSAGGLPDLAVRAVQLYLTYHGFDPGKIDGVAGARTRAAITAFATQHDLPATPANHQDLQAALRDRLTPVPGEMEAVASAAPARSPSAPDLRIVQSLLAYLGYDPGPIDGKPGPRTRSAATAFQRSHGAEATGKADGPLFVALKAATRQAFADDQMADIRLVQRILGAKGFDAGRADGLIGPKTRAAVMAFQQAQGARPTGAVDTTLLDALFTKD
jgi:peptidoglycan hydrolase-like protein with peptidoglycan-binding domain